MKKLSIMLSLAGVMAAPSLFASMSVQLYQDTGNYSYGNGGEFRAVGNADLNAVVSFGSYSAATSGTLASGGQYFETFCTELLEEFTPGNSYAVSAIGNNAMYNHTSGPNGIPITLGIAYLYSQFAAGTLNGYDYTYGSGRTTTAGQLQTAIWIMLGETSGTMATWVTDDLTAALGSDTSKWYQASDGAYGVHDMVLLQPGDAQDQLVVVPEPTTVLAGALLLLPFGASTLRILRRTRTAHQS